MTAITYTSEMALLMQGLKTLLAAWTNSDNDTMLPGGVQIALVEPVIPKTPAAWLTPHRQRDLKGDTTAAVDLVLYGRPGKAEDTALAICDLVQACRDFLALRDDRLAEGVDTLSIFETDFGVRSADGEPDSQTVNPYVVLTIQPIWLDD